MHGLLASGLLIGWFAVRVDAAAARPEALSGPQTACDVAPFGEVTRWDNEGKDYGIVWEDARDIHRVMVTFAAQDDLPPPAAVHLEYWQSSWPQRRIPRDRKIGAGSSGWLDIGDWFQGKWKTADADLSVDGNRYTFTFRPVNQREFKDLDDFAAVYRTTLKLRLVAAHRLPSVAALQAFTDSVWKPLEVAIEWRGAAAVDTVWDGHLEAFNGIVQSVRPLAATSHVQVATDRTWKSTVQESTDGIRAELLYADTKGCNSFDATVMTVRTGAGGTSVTPCAPGTPGTPFTKTFSFAVDDLLRWGYIFLPDFGVVISKADAPVSYQQARATWLRARQQEAGKDLYSRVSAAPEQTLTQAWNDTPPKGAHYIPLSFEGGRQHFGVEANGSIFCIKNWITRLPGKETPRCRWQGDTLRIDLGLPDARPDSRGLVDGYLPMVDATWTQGDIAYQQEAFVIPLHGVPQAGGRIWADDPLVLMTRLRLTTIGQSVALARLEMVTADANGPQSLKLHGQMVFAGTDGPDALRMCLRDPAEQRRWQLAAHEGKILCGATLGGPQRPAVLDVAIPQVDLSEPAEQAALAGLRFDDALKQVRRYWRGRVAAGTQIVTPEPMINDFYRADVSHLLINTEREVGVSDRYMAKVGTFHYGVFANESCMMVSDLDRRGYHQRAEQALETWLHYQGTVGLPGDFSSAQGQFYGAGGYEHGGYNQHHGWVLWCLGEHYLITRDDAWLARVAPQIIAGCDWILRERRQTVAAAAQSPLRAIERGLLPSGRLEDIGDWRAWLSTNVYSWWGLQNAAAALASGKHPDAKRLLRAADDYGKEILTAYTEAMRRSPVVRLRDTSWIPHVPADVHRRGRSFGWITETLEGAIHLVRCGLVKPHDPIATWIIKDFEDNLYLSEQFGYDLKGKEFDRYWFSRGGISMQANLLCNPIPYLLRDEPKHFLRAYFNAFAVSYFPDTRMMTEHALPHIGDWRGDHYKASDESNSTYWLRLMFVQERGNDLWLGAALPRYWLSDGQQIGIERAATYFGSVSLRMTSHVSEGYIEARVTPPQRNPPARTFVRFRHPEGRRITRCLINGTPCGSFDPEKEWVEMPRSDRPAKIVAIYD